MAIALYRLGRWCARHPWRTVLGWVLVIATVGALAGTLGRPTTEVVELPEARFLQVMEDVQREIPEVSGNTGTAVFATDDGSGLTGDQRRAIAAVVETWQDDTPHVTSVPDPFRTQARLDRADQRLADGRRRLGEGEQRLRAGELELAEGRQLLALGEAALADAERTAPRSPATARLRAQVEDGRAELATGERRLEEARAELEQGRLDLARGERVREGSRGVRFVSEDGSAAVTQIGFDLDPQSLEPADRQRVIDAAADLPEVGVTASFGNELTTDLELLGVGELVGLAVATTVLLVMLGSVVAAGLPLVVALVGVGVGLAGAVAATYFFEMHSMTPALAVMLGLAVGIDYMLFILNRHRSQFLHGMELAESVGRANGSAGNAVVFAGSTVVVALAALVMSGIPVLAQMGLVAAGTVTTAVLVAITLGPALLGLVGRRLATGRAWRRATAAHAGRSEEEHGGWYVRLVTTRPWLTVVAVLVAVGIVAVPVADLRLGLPDGSSEAPGSSANTAYTTVAEKFGPGMNGPLLVVAELEDGTTAREAEVASAEIGGTLLKFRGVDSVVPIGRSEDSSTLAWQVVLESGPTEEATTRTVQAIREATPALDEVYEAEIGITGRTVANIEISQQLADALPGYLAVVVGLSLLILVAVFRSVVVPLVATGGFLLSVAAAFGMSVAVFQWGWLGGIFGVHEPGPIMSFGPIMLIGVLFGLAMDYQMFLVSGMHEAHAHGEDARRAVRSGFVHGAKVVTAAAAIMFSVFGGFVFSHMVMIKPIGFGLAMGVLVDAVLVRMTLTPAVMHLLGERAWWIPRWLDRVIPDLDVEGTSLSARLDAERERARTPATVAG